MKDQSVYDLWVVKQMVKGCPFPPWVTAVVERINKVLLEENGAWAVLFSYRPTSGTPDEAICGSDFLKEENEENKPL